MAAGAGVQCIGVYSAVPAWCGAGCAAAAGEGGVYGESGADARGGGGACAAVRGTARWGQRATYHARHLALFVHAGKEYCIWVDNVR